MSITYLARTRSSHDAADAAATTSPTNGSLMRAPIWSRLTHPNVPGTLFVGNARLQTRLEIGAADDPLEREADATAEQVLHMPDSVDGPARMAGRAVGQLRRTCACGGTGDAECPTCAAQRLQRRSTGAAGGAEAPPIVHEALDMPGRPLDISTRAFMEPRIGADLGGVRVHTGGKADESARAVGALAYTVGQDIVFGAGRYAPSTAAGDRLLAHELSHVVQQVGGEQRFRVRRKLGDGHDLTSPRFSKLLDLEDVYDGTSTLRKSVSKGRGVQAVQQALYDIGFTGPMFGADADFGDETEKAVKAFQKSKGMSDTGVVDAKTMEELDKRFPTPTLPSAADRAATWTSACVLKILCPWSPHSVEVMRTKITLKSFDNISWADEEWDGAAWKPAPFPGGGYNTGTEIGVLNSSCEKMSQTIYHEVLHAEQPTTHKTTLQKESYAYRIGEEFSIAMGLSGRPALRSTDVQGRQFADPATVEAFVKKEYPSVPKGAPGEQILRKSGAAGDVEVQKPDGTIYTRKAVVGEKAPGPMSTVNEVTHSTGGWTCP